MVVPRTSDKQGIACENSLVVAILKEIADAVLGVAGRVQCLDLDAADRELLAVLGSLGDLCAVFTTNDWDGVGLELGKVSWSVLEHGLGSWRYTISSFPPAWSQWLGWVNCDCTKRMETAHTGEC